MSRISRQLRKTSRRVRFSYKRRLPGPQKSATEKRGLEKARKRRREMARLPVQQVWASNLWEELPLIVRALATPCWIRSSPVSSTSRLLMPPPANCTATSAATLTPWRFSKWASPSSATTGGGEIGRSTLKILTFRRRPICGGNPRWRCCRQTGWTSKSQEETGSRRRSSSGSCGGGWTRRAEVQSRSPCGWPSMGSTTRLIWLVYWRGRLCRRVWGSSQD